MTKGMTKMLSPSQLERATPGYRRGYNDATYNRAKATNFNGPWEAKDYEDGYNAALNDKRH
jgi:hypothetical protein